MFYVLFAAIPTTTTTIRKEDTENVSQLEAFGLMCAETLPKYIEVSIMITNF